jgi:hypothetical protein
MGIRRAAQFAVPRDGLNVQLHHLKSSGPASCDHQFDWHEQWEPGPAEFGIAGAVPLLGQSATPERPVLAKLGWQPEFGRTFQEGQVISGQ